MSAAPPPRPLRILVVCPSWVGDAVMATPALRRLRTELPGAIVEGLMRPGIERVLDAPSRDGFVPFFDAVHVDRPRGVMGHKHAAARLRARRFDTAVLLTNSFSTALTTRLAGIPRRIGYDRDGRGLLLTRRLLAPRDARGAWAIVPAVDYYWHAIGHVVAIGREGEPEPGVAPANEEGEHRLPVGVAMELPITAADEDDAARVRDALGLDGAFCLLNPGGNNPAKRWPGERFGELAQRLHGAYGWRVLVNGSPGEREVVGAVVSASGGVASSLVDAGGTLGSLKVLVRDAALLVTNDTGPRHFAAAVRTPVVTLFGPTDHRWTTIPAPAGESIVVADPTLPLSESANDHPERCRVDRITTERAWEAVQAVLGEGTRGAGDRQA